MPGAAARIAAGDRQRDPDRCVVSVFGHEARRGGADLGEDQDELERRDDFARLQDEARGFGGLDHGFGIDAIFRGGAGTAAAREKVDDAEPSLRLERAGDVAKQRENHLRLRRVVHLAIRVDDQHGVEAAGQARIGRRAEHRAHVARGLRAAVAG